MAHVTVAIASCGRSSLAKTLASIDAQAVPETWTVEVVVADDSLDGSAAEITRASGLSLPVQVISVASRNIAKARNACLDAARGEYIIFIDDDEIAGQAWIQHMVEDARRTDADCLFAPVQPEYGPQAPAWIVALNPLFPSEVRTARRGEFIVGRTGNSLLRRAFIDRHNLRFDVSFRTGVEDLHFFALCRANSAKMATTDRAAVREPVEACRTTLGYVLRLCFARGKGYARVMSMTGQDGFAGGYKKALASSFAKLVVCSLLACSALPFGPLRWIRFASTAAINLGKVAYLVRGEEQPG